MLKYILAAAFAVLAITTTPASALDLYGKVSVGQAIGTEVQGFDLADDLSYAVAIGAPAGPGRLELGVSRISADTAGLSAHAVDYSATYFLDFQASDRSAFFVGAGLDYLEAEAGIGPFTVEGSGDGWHVTGGYARRISDGIILEASVTQLEADLDFSGFDVEASTQLVQLSARFDF